MPDTPTPTTPSSGPIDEKGKLLYDLEERGKGEGQKQPKAIYSGDSYDGQPVIVLTERNVNMFADDISGITVSKKFGILLSGDIHFACMPHQMSFGGGYWRLDPRHLAVLASTTPTPIPLLVKAWPDLLKAKGAVQDAVNNVLEPNSNINAGEGAVAGDITGIVPVDSGG